MLFLSRSMTQLVLERSCKHRGHSHRRADASSDSSQRGGFQILEHRSRGADRCGGSPDSGGTAPDARLRSGSNTCFDRIPHGVQHSSERVPSAAALVAPIAYDRVPVTICVFLVFGHNHEPDRHVRLESWSTIETYERLPQDGKLYGELIAFLRRRIVRRRSVRDPNVAIRKDIRLELGRLAGLAVVEPQAGGHLAHVRAPYLPGPATSGSDTLKSYTLSSCQLLKCGEFHSRTFRESDPWQPVAETSVTLLQGCQQFAGKSAFNSPLHTGSITSQPPLQSDASIEFDAILAVTASRR